MGKLEEPVILARALGAPDFADLSCDRQPADMQSRIVAKWDFTGDQASDRVVDRGGLGLHAECINLPVRAVVGRRWGGRSTNFNEHPEEFGAIELHPEDLGDAGWSPSFKWVVPRGTRSGVYAARLTTGGATDYIPFNVAPPCGGVPAPVAVLLPSFTYLAYANERIAPERAHHALEEGWLPERDPLDDYLDAHPEFGLSLYDLRSDGSGSCYSSFKRAIPNLRPDYRSRFVNAARHLGGDLYLIDWLEHIGAPYVTITDHDLHREGVGLLSGFKVVITGSHPEYASVQTLDALEGYLANGGRLMYLGGNGFYYVTSVLPERPDVIEVRRGLHATRPWTSHPGECFHSATGERGGHWRLRGRPPNRLVGVGSTAMGAGGRSAGYRRTLASHDPRVAFIFDGLSEDEVIGEFGLSRDGAAGDELDRADFELGTPRNAVVLATATGFSKAYETVMEDLDPGADGAQHREIRADMVYFELREGGAVFSTGSIAWSASLSHNQYRNNVSRVTGNVLKQFAGID